MNNYIDVSIKVCTKSNFYRRLVDKNIDIRVIEETSNTIRCYVRPNDLKKLNKFYDIKINKAFNINTIKNYFKNNILKYMCIIFGIFLYGIFTNTIVDVRINSNNNELVDKLNKSLDKYGIKRFTFKKNFDDINKIKNELMIEYKDYIEWLEIKLDGMKYIVNLEERVSNEIKEEKEYCNVYATTDAIVTKVFAEKGTSLINEFSYVREGDILISGDIKLNEEVKSSVCASGVVYGEVWYQLSISIPKTYEEEFETGKYRYNLAIESGNKDYIIFKSRLDKKIEEKQEILSLLGKKLYIIKEKEIGIVTKNYTEEEIKKKVDEIIANNLKLNIENGEKVLYKKVLKKYEFDSKIDLEVFVTVEKIISSN